MNRKSCCLLPAIWLLATWPLHGYDHPFQNPSLSNEARLTNLISLMSVEEKIANLASRPPGVPRLEVRGTRLMEGYHGLAHSGPANWAIKGEGEAPTTTFPQAIGLAQMWDPELLEKLAAWEAYECRFLAQNPDYGRAGLIILSPNADLGRDIRWGRTEECYGEDAFLAGALTVAFVKGLQGDDPKYWRTASLLKHFLANSNENNRFTDSSDFDDRLFREYYAYPFYKGIVEGGSRAIMAAYNKYNGIPCAVHPVLREIVIKEWGLNGIICTDGGAFKRLVRDHRYYDDDPAAAEGCIDAGITMFLDDYKPSLRTALEQGLIAEEDIDRAVRGTLRVLLKLGLLDNSPDNPYASIGFDDPTFPWTKPEAKALARQATVKSVVLLKNEGGLLPLDRTAIRSIAVIGPSADRVIPDWYGGTPPYTVSVLEGISNALGTNAVIRYAADNKGDAAIRAARESDVAVVCVGNDPLSHGLDWGENHVWSDGREEVDRQALSLEQEDLVKLVKANNPNTVLVLVSSFPYAIAWSAENVPAILHIAQSSQELGNGLADIIFGKGSPAGRLVQTWSTSIDELPPILDYNIRNGRTYMYLEQPPLFAFGHGLTYSTFAYSDLALSPDSLRMGDTLDVSLALHNSGGMDSDEVVQVYVAHPKSKVERPRMELKGFRRVHVPAGTEQAVSIPIQATDLAYWDTRQRTFVLEPGPIEIWIGSASDQIHLKGSVPAK